MRARSIAAVFAAVLLVGSLAGCSKKDSGSDDSASDKTEETQKSTTTESDDSSDSDSESDSSGGLDDVTDLMGDCGQAAILYSSLIASSASLMGGATDEQIKDLEEQAESLRDDVPKDLHDDMEVVAEAYKKFAVALSKGSFMDEDVQQAAEDLDSGEVKAATENLDEYFNTCDS